MAAPMHELVGVATARLKAYTDLTALVPATKIFYRPPSTFVPPYITIDDAYSIREDATCIDGLNVTLNIHVWTDDSHPLPNGGGALQDARAIAYQVAKALHHFPLALPTQTLVTIEHRGERIFYDSDGTTGHGVVEFLAVMETT